MTDFCEQRPVVKLQTEERGSRSPSGGGATPSSSAEPGIEGRYRIERSTSSSGRKTVPPLSAGSVRRTRYQTSRARPSGMTWPGYNTDVPLFTVQMSTRERHRPSADRTQAPDDHRKIERFHRTLRQEFLTGRTFDDLKAAQAELDRWIESYNTERPHSALEMATPVSRCVEERPECRLLQRE